MSSRGGVGRVQMTSSDNCNSNSEKMSLTSSTLKVRLDEIEFLVDV